MKRIWEATNAAKRADEAFEAALCKAYVGRWDGRDHWTPEIKVKSEHAVWHANVALDELWPLADRVSDFSDAHRAGIIFG